MAPRDVEVPVAASPATPAPTTKTFAGGTLPAAVTWPVKNRPKLLPASITARYPAILAIEDKRVHFLGAADPRHHIHSNDVGAFGFGQF